ncbi:AAA family ATPase [Phytoactinopolyspora halotolerans]|uniref:ATPase n=1 Tax=Phytoactinopolyspora halotolerans TaxID=1981512 RepID=A0A6L9S6M1_9ACTN|nr:ATPase [Phytoactinopolyspora halotolerans]NEE01115.1 ATPase [Phytoactinopolyspora halotolerans]
MTSLSKPQVLFDRDDEWAQLVDFMSPHVDSLRLGVVYGRRRQGKSEMLQQLCDASGGFYMLALERNSKPLALQRFADELAEWAGLPAGMRFSSWENALETAVRMAGERAGQRGEVQLLVLDELPFLIAHSPELPGVLQWLHDTYGPTKGGGAPPVRLILCGSALSVMSELLAESKALYGRVQLNICLNAFDHIDSAAFWGVDDPDTAVRLHAIVGGIPGYRALTDGVPVPDSREDLGRWLAATAFNPAHAMFDEVDLLFSQEPGIKDRALYYGILAAIAAGESTPARIASRLERDSRTMSYPLTTLRRAGFISYDEDMLRERKPIVSIADPVMRFHHTITLPRLQIFQRRSRAEQGWQQAQATFDSQILGPHFEHLAREWTISELAARGDVPIGWTGTTSVACREHKVSHEIDVISLMLGDMPRTSSARVALIGEAKSTNTVRDRRDLARLEHIRGLLGGRAEEATLAIFSRSGFSDELIRLQHRRDVLLVTLDDMYRR